MIVGLLLAAGAGTRFGGGKLLAPLPDGTPVGVRSARLLRGAVDRAVAVVRPGDEALATLLRGEGLDVAPCPRAAEGMGASLAFGVASAPDADGWVVALADMPFLAGETVGRVASELRKGAWIAVPVFRGRRGHPVGFTRALSGELTALDGDAGARALLERHASKVVSIECADFGILEDVDAPGDLPGRAGGR